MGSDYRVMLAVPHNGTICYGTAQGMFRAAERNRVAIQNHGTSLLATGFNTLLCCALNEYEKGEITHLAFLNSDIAPADCWVDTLVDEMDRLHADFVSCVVAIKDTFGLTSTGIGKPGLTWTPFRRLTMTEVMALPETFNAESAGYPGKVLLHNSGCWLADLRSPVFRQTEIVDGVETAKVFFTIKDRVTRVDGLWKPSVEPEDWFFSRCLHEAGAVSYATRKVATRHVGPMAFSNESAWGSWTVDEATRPLWEAT